MICFCEEQLHNSERNIHVMKMREDILNDWIIKKKTNSSNLSQINLTDTQYNPEQNTTFRYKEANNGKGRCSYGFDYKNESAFDAFRWYGFRLNVETVEEQSIVDIRAGFYSGIEVSHRLYFASAGIHEVDVKLTDFDLESSKSNLWRELVEISVDGNSVFHSLELIRQKSIYISTDIAGKSGDVGEDIFYNLQVFNCTEENLAISIKQCIEGWESLYPDINPKEFILPGNGVQDVQVTVKIHDYMVAGCHEVTKLRFIPNGDSSAAVEQELYTMCKLEYPYIYHNKDGWQQVKEKIKKFDKFTPAYNQIIKDADSWEVKPPVEERDYCYNTREEHYIMSCAYGYSLTSKIEYAHKIAKFFRYFIDEEKGYPYKKKGCSQSYVQEGHFFQHLAIGYEIIHDSGVLRDEDHKGIERCFRIYMEILDWHIMNGHISNWILSELTGAVYCAMVLQDMERVQRFVFGPQGSIDELKRGAFNDGWWYECSVGYNIWVSSMFLHTARALLPFGINILHTHFQIPYNKEVSASYPGQKTLIRFGMYNEKWGGIQKNYICIKDLFDAVIPFLDYRGVLFGINDSAEKKITGVHFGSTFDLAYTYYKDPAYIPVIQLFDEEDPIFGHGVLPSTKNQLGKGNAYADNIGIAMLRSNTPDREIREQIQAVLRYGSHGYAHGHYDRTELLSLMRYGRNFFNPEHVWWGYGNFMYKFYVQNSITKNMVNVDEKMQLPADSKRLLFYSGSSMQATAVTTTSRWSYPPYGGMVYDSNETLEERCEWNGCSLPVIDNGPSYGELTECTEPIKQTRVMVVMDDYIILFDYLKGEEEHTYENLLQIKGFQGLHAGDAISKVEYIEHTGQKTTNPISDSQFVTDCNWYKVKGTSLARFSTVYGPGEDMRGTRSEFNEPGVLNMDVYTAWPKQSVQMDGLVAEDHGIHIPFSYQIIQDGVCKQEDKSNGWILGSLNCDLDITGAENLEIAVFCGSLYNEQRYPFKAKQGLFWGEAYVICDDGRRIDLVDMELSYENVDQGYGFGKDYEDGRVLITGVEYKNAIPTSPVDHDSPGVIKVNLSNLNPVRFVGRIGADGFPGDESQRRRTYAVRTKGNIARYITVIEPFENKKQVLLVEGNDENTVKVCLKQGIQQIVRIEGIEEEQIAISMKEYSNGQLVGEENTFD